MTVIGASAPLFEEQLRVGGRGWLWLPPVLAITFLAVAPIIVPIALGAWLVNVARFWTTTVRIDDERVWVGRRSVRLVALDLTTLGRAQNTWPWRSFSRRWLGGNPIWTSDSVGVRGFDDGKPWWVSVGTNRREELVAVLEGAVLAAARADAGAHAHARRTSRVAPRPLGSREPRAVVGRHPVDRVDASSVVVGGVGAVIPMADENPVQRFPIVTLLLIVICVVVYFAVQPTGTPDIDWTGVVERVDQDDLRFVVDNAAIPCELVELRPLTEREYEATFRDDNRSACNVGGGTEHSPGKVVLLGVLVTMFLHGSVAHLFGNMLFLWVFGNNVESRRGRVRYLLLYVVGGVAATAAHVAIDPQSTVPVVGASGAIAAVMGAYLVCWPTARIKTIIFVGPVLLRKVEAIWLLLVWIGTQFLLVGGDSEVAWAAHVGGFAFGVLVGLWWRRSDARASAALGEPATAPA